jgi:hypothetical protein
MRSLLMAFKESVLDRRYRVVIYAMLHSVRVVIVGLIITVGCIQIESGANIRPIRYMAWDPCLVQHVSAAEGIN